MLVPAGSKGLRVSAAPRKAGAAKRLPAVARPRNLAAPRLAAPAPKQNVYTGSSPVISRYKVQVQVQKRAGRVGSIEFYKGGTDGYTAPTVVVYGNRKLVPSKDIEGDIVSHYLARGADPVLTRFYRGFVASMTPAQQKNLRMQYAWAQTHEREKRPFAVWADMTGIPAYFRGYAFKQWANPQHWYTPAQLKMFDAMLSYLKTGYQI